MNSPDISLHAVNFSSDNVAPVGSEIMDAIAAVNDGPALSYGNDDETGSLTELFSELFETEVSIFPVATGTAANVLSLAMLTPPYGAIYCHEIAHIEVDECGAPEFYTGAKIVPIAGEHGRLSPRALEEKIQNSGIGVEHRVQSSAISLTQATENGTCYQPEQLSDISQIARRFGLGVHMDGARFANAVSHLRCDPADITWRAGVDILSFGATKNGAMAAEAVVVFKPHLAKNFKYWRKRSGHLFSKMRYISAQLSAYIKNDLWINYADQANAMARKLSDGLSVFPGLKIAYPVECNEVFVWMPEGVISGLKDKGFGFSRWGGEKSSLLRLVTCFNTTEEDVSSFISAVSALT